MNGFLIGGWETYGQDKRIKYGRGKKVSFHKAFPFLSGNDFPSLRPVVMSATSASTLMAAVPNLTHCADMMHKVLHSDVTSKTTDAASLESCCRHVSSCPWLACGCVSRRGACFKGLLELTRCSAELCLCCCIRCDNSDFPQSNIQTSTFVSAASQSVLESFTVRDSVLGRSFSYSVHESRNVFAPRLVPEHAATRPHASRRTSVTPSAATPASRLPSLV